MPKGFQGFQKGYSAYWEGKKLSKETRKKLSESHRGNKPSVETRKKMSLNNARYWKDKKLSEETKRKLSIVHKGKKLSTDHKINIGKSVLGRKHTEETKRRLSEQKKGERNPFWNKKLSLTTKLKISEALKGERGSNWKGGITILTKQIRGSFRYRQWRSDVFTRDDYTCVLCGKRGCYLEVDHHPKRFSVIFQESKVKTLEEALGYEEFWNINNGRTLCRECHNKTKGRGKR